MENLHHDLCIEILSYLPVKSLLRFRSVSASWRAEIDSPNFSQKHLTRFPNNLAQSHLFAAQHRLPSTNFSIKCRKTLKTESGIRLPHTNLNWSPLFSTDGIFMFTTFTVPQDPTFMLWNPSIRKSRILPPPPKPSISPSQNHDFGIGFDPIEKEYKFVRFHTYAGIGDDWGVIAIYSIGTDSWKTIDLNGKDPWYPMIMSTQYKESERCCFRGVLYALTTSYLLHSFDLAANKLALIGLPGHHTMCASFSPVVDSLELVCLSEKEGAVWAFESQGGDLKYPSWAKRYTFPMMPFQQYISTYSHILFQKETGEVWFKPYNRNGAVSYNLETRKERIIILQDNEGWIWPYNESLILL